MSDPKVRMPSILDYDSSPPSSPLSSPSPSPSQLKQVQQSNKPPLQQTTNTFASSHHELPGDSFAQTQFDGPLPSTPRKNKIAVSSSLLDVYSPLKPKTPKRNPPPPATDTPIARKMSGQHGAFLPSRSEDNARRHAREGRKVIIGPMPVEEFFSEFLPPLLNDDSMPNADGAFDGVPSEPGDEKDIYDPLTASINTSKRCPSLKFCVTSDIAEVPGLGSLKPDICAFRPKDVRRVTHRSKKGGLVKYAANLGLADLFIEIKKRKDQDPFCDDHSHAPGGKDPYRKSFFAYDNFKNKEPNLSDAGKEARANLGQNVAYSSEACSRQHRAFYFSILVVGTTARFFRWDRAGGIVIRAFDYKENPELLCEFLWRFHLANAVQRGFDPTVSIASESEEQLFKRLITEHIKFQLNLDPSDREKLDDELKIHYEKGRVTRIEVYDGVRTTPDVYLVSVPLKSPKSAAGRATRAYWAVRIMGPSEGEVCFLKDTWRVDVCGVGEEGDIYRDLEGKKVVNTCDLEVYGNVPDFDLVGEADEEDANMHGEQAISKEDPIDEATTDEYKAYVQAQCTRTNDFIGRRWVCECLRENLQQRIPKHTHYRLALKQAGYSLRRFKGSRELFEGCADALEALNSAYEAGRLHRDVSIDNIILFRFELGGRRRGLLADWEFSTLVDRTGKAADYFRSGTWAFMSGELLRGGIEFRHTREDDMESLFYVAMYGSVRSLPHNYTAGLGQWMFKFFDDSKEENGRDSGGVEKRDLQSSWGGDFVQKFGFKNEYIRTFFKGAYEYLATNHVGAKLLGQKLKWTVQNLRGLFRNVCHGLSSSNETDRDAEDHQVDDYYMEPKETHHGTYTHVSIAEASNRVPAGSGSAYLGSKRTLEGDIDGPSRLNDEGPHDPKEPVSKRKRRDSKEQVIVTDEEMDSQPAVGRISKKLSSRSIRSTKSAHRAPALDDGSSRINSLRSSSRRLRSGRSASLGSGERRSARLATRPSSSSLKSRT